MTGEGKPPSAWLRKITEDQNLNQLSEIENIVYDTLRQLFMSAEIKPDVNMGYYDDDTSRIVLGPNPVDKALINSVYTMKDIITNNDTTSVAYKEWTVPAGYQWIVIFASMSNATDSPYPTLSITPAGGSLTTIGYYNSAGLQSRYMNLLSWDIYGLTNYLVLDSGDKIRLTDGNFTAADNMDYWIGYVQVAVA